MYKLIALCVLLTVTGGCTANNSIRADYIVENVQVISMESPDILYDRAVIIHNNKIQKIIKQSKAANVARYLGEAGTAGVISPGARADFILLEKNPLVDINNSRSLGGVFTRGKWFSKEDLTNMTQP